MQGQRNLQEQKRRRNESVLVNQAGELNFQWALLHQMLAYGSPYTFTDHVARSTVLISIASVMKITVCAQYCVLLGSE